MTPQRSQRALLCIIPLALGATACIGDDTPAGTATATLSAGGSVSAGSDAETTTGTETGATDSTSSGATDSTTGSGPCADDTITCEGDVALSCDGRGGVLEEICEEACVDGLGCTCEPGSRRCFGDAAQHCSVEGAWVEVDDCDPLLGLSCDPEASACVGACAGLGPSAIGCDYFATSITIADEYFYLSDEDFGVVVINEGAAPATVTVTRTGEALATVEVAAGGAETIILPWMQSPSHGSAIFEAFRVRSTRPVAVYQRHALHGEWGFTEASLLLPTNTWGTASMAASWPVWSTKHESHLQGGFYAVVAREDDTTVTLTPSASGAAVSPGAGVAADGTGVVTLDEGEVLQVHTGYLWEASDPTGTLISADKPVGVLSGHEGALIPGDDPPAHPFAGRLEEMTLPQESLATEYVVVPPARYPATDLEQPQVVRIIAAEAGTNLTFEPDQPVAKTLAKAGDFVELAMTTASFQVRGDKKFTVVQYMRGAWEKEELGGPAMLLTAAPANYRGSYRFFSDPTWVANFADIIAPAGTTVSVDGDSVVEWTAIGATGYSVAHVLLSDEALHAVEASAPVGVSVYGYNKTSSFWYNAGLYFQTIE